MINKDNEQFVGVDLHTNRLTAFYIQGNGERFSQNFELDDLQAFIETLQKNAYVAVEASCNTFRFCDQLKARTSNVMVVNPYKMKLISMVNKKTDRVDSEKLAMFLKSHVLGGEEMIEPVWVPDQTIRNLRSAFATFKNLRAQIVMTKNRVHALMKQNMIFLKASNITSAVGRKRMLEACASDCDLHAQVSLLLEMLVFQERKASEFETEIKRLAKPYRGQIEILTSFPGISVLTACALIADIGDISRFASAKKLSSYLRSAPGVDSSNEVTKIKKTSKLGRRLSVGLLIQGVTHFKTAHPGLASWHESMMERRKSKGKTRIGVVRKVICQVYQMLSKGEYHYYRNGVLHLEKMRDYDRLLEKIAA
jgi:transposase